MHLLIASYAAILVAGIFCTWQHYHQNLLARERRLRERVAYMLWVMANGPENETQS